MGSPSDTTYKILKWKKDQKLHPADFDNMSEYEHPKINSSRLQNRQISFAKRFNSFEMEEVSIFSLSNSTQ